MYRDKGEYICMSVYLCMSIYASYTMAYCPPSLLKSGLLGRTLLPIHTHNNADYILIRKLYNTICVDKSYQHRLL